MSYYEQKGLKEDALLLGLLYEITTFLHYLHKQMYVFEYALHNQ